MKKFLLIILAPFVLWAKSPLIVTETDSQIIYYAFNNQFDEGNELVEKMIESNSDTPKYYFLKLIVNTFEVQAQAEDYEFEKRREFRNRKNKELIEYTENIIEDFKDIERTDENRFYLANLYGYLGRMHGEARSYISALNNVKKGKGILEDLVEENPQFYDAYLLLGMFEYYADRLGGLTKFIAGILGFSGNRDTGMKYMNIAYENGSLLKPVAEFILGETYLFQESNSFTALKYFESLIRKYPDNSSFYDWYVRILMNLHRYNEAETAIQNDSSGLVSEYTKAAFYFDTGRYNKAQLLFDEIIQHKLAKWWFTYEHSKVLNAYSMLFTGKNIEINEVGLDFYDKDREKKWREELNEIKVNLDDAKKIFNFAAKVNLFEKNKGGTESIIPEINITRSKILAAAYMYFNGVYAFKKGEFRQAENYFLNVAKHKTNYSDRAAEFLIEIYKRNNTTENQIDDLEDIIDNLDDDDLKFSFMGLKEKIGFN